MHMASAAAPSKRRRTAAVYKPGKFDCCNCRRDIRGETHVRHRDREHLALCTECYSTGVPLASYLASPRAWTSEDVRLIDTSTTRMPLLSEDWSGEQEVKLLEGILQFGFGNWRAVGEHMGFEKAEAECEDHYERFYVRSKCFPLPDLSGPPKPPGSAQPPAAAPAPRTAPQDPQRSPPPRPRPL